MRLPFLLLLALVGPTFLAAQSWVQETATAGWSARGGHASVVFDNRIWVIGGADSAVRRDVWSSTDGVSWSQVTANAPWAARYVHQVVVFNNLLWLMSGYDGTYAYRDVWHSSNGTNWTQGNTAGWSARYLTTAVVFNNRMWVMGGYDSSGPRNDVWSTADGSNWTQETSAAGWTARGGHTATVYDGRLWVMGGYSNTHHRDVWSSSNGVNWTQETATADWPVRAGHSAGVVNNRLWVMGGYNGSVFANDVWYTTDGSSWTQQTSSAGWAARSVHSMVTHNDKLFLMGGNSSAGLRRDVWSIHPVDLLVSATPGSRDVVSASDTGPGGNGVLAGLFSIQNSMGTNAELYEILIAASGTGNDAADFSEVALCFDANDNGTYEPGTDTLVASHSAFPTDDGSLAFQIPAADQPFATNTTRRYFVVVKMAGSGFPTATYDFTVSDLTLNSGTSKVGLPSATMLGVQIEAATLTVSATSGAAVQAMNDDTGAGGLGIEAATFQIAADALAGGNLLEIHIASSGSGNDALDFSEVAVYQETNSVAGYQGGGAGDTLVASFAAFPSNNGTLAFPVPAALQSFGANETRQYYVVVALAGTAAPGATFNFRITELAVQNSFKAGLPSVVMNGIQVIAATVSVSAVQAAAQLVYANEQGAGGHGIHAATFTVSSDNLPGAELRSVEITASGSGHDVNAYAEVALYMESNTTSGFQGGGGSGDTLVDTFSAFPSDNGTRAFNLDAQLWDMAQNESRTFYVVTRLSGAAVPGQTFNFQVSGIVTGSNFKQGVPSTVMTGLVIRTPQFTVTDTTLNTAPMEVFVGTSNVAMQAFSVEYPEGPNNSLAEIHIRGAGSGNEITHINQVRLYRDQNADGVLDAGDALLASLLFPQNDGLIAFPLTGQAPFIAPEIRHYLVVYDFRTNIPHGATFRCYVTATAGSTTGTVVNGLPAPDANGTPGAVINANFLDVTLHGPGTARTVGNDSSGSTGDGEVLLDVSIAPSAVAWDLITLTFAAAGTADFSAAYAELNLYEDSGNGLFGGRAQDPPAAPALAGFDAAGLATFTLNQTAAQPGAPRRFFLAAKLAGTAVAGQTLNARLESVNAVSAMYGKIRGLPTADSTALIIDVAVLTVARGDNPPANVTLRAGSITTHTLGKLRLSAVNNVFEVSSLRFTGGGSGDLAVALDPVTGVQVWLDDGDDAFDAATDLLLFEGPGGTAVDAQFMPPLNVPNGGTLRLWLVVNLTPQAGQGAVEAAATYNMRIVAATDINATGGAAVLGTPLPLSSTLGLVDFFVTSFTPGSDAPKGGKPIAIEGSGLAAPLRVRVGGLDCTGVAVISQGTTVTGLFVPPSDTGAAAGLPIEITTALLPDDPLTLSQTFAYRRPPTEESGCAAGRQGAAWTLMALTLIALLAGNMRRPSRGGHFKRCQ
jgi:hypothetical protein